MRNWARDMNKEDEEYEKQEQEKDWKEKLIGGKEDEREKVEEIE